MHDTEDKARSLQLPVFAADKHTVKGCCIRPGTAACPCVTVTLQHALPLALRTLSLQQRDTLTANPGWASCATEAGADDILPGEGGQSGQRLRQQAVSLMAMASYVRSPTGVV